MAKSKNTPHGKATASTSYAPIKKDKQFNSGNLHTKANTSKGSKAKNLCMGGNV